MEKKKKGSKLYLEGLDYKCSQPRKLWVEGVLKEKLPLESLFS